MRPVAMPRRAAGGRARPRAAAMATFQRVPSTIAAAGDHLSFASHGLTKAVTRAATRGAPPAPSRACRSVMFIGSWGVERRQWWWWCGLSGVHGRGRSWECGLDLDEDETCFPPEEEVTAAGGVAVLHLLDADGVGHAGGIDQGVALVHPPGEGPGEVVLGFGGDVPDGAVSAGLLG